ncbi:MAG: hypothetical protein LRY73_02215 [Bacillus sp. (in: Bacteria)]|nr:hypothetical protein [Bacillus sp. (in: firmicutes)]
MAEYALILGVLAVGIVAVLVIFGDVIIDTFWDVIEGLGGDREELDV